MFLGFRSVRNSLLAFVSTTLGFIWSAGLLALAGVEIDLFSLFAAVTFIGIATDYDIYVIYRFSVEGTRPMREVLTRAGPGILVAGGTTLIGFGSLINSSYGPLRSFGITSVTMIGCSLVASLLVLPAAAAGGGSAVTVCALIAAFNEEATIAAVVAGVRRHVPDVVVVDDGSADRTAELRGCGGRHGHPATPRTAARAPPFARGWRACWPAPTRTCC